jgi:4-amino-4-deoxy-L-arabinose transferase-like glycosyltransferase
MSTYPATADAPRRPAARPFALPRSLTRMRPELAALLLLAAVLNLWALSRNGMANEYYSAAVRSMASNWHAFLYGSFDQGGVMTLDKPPLAFWVQALSVKVFGFSSLSMLVPQALMGVGSVGLTYDLVRRTFGRTSGFTAGLVLALTPIAVAISRHNNPDALLVLCSVAALWFVVRGLEDGRTRWLVFAGVAVGLGFETKMAVALMVVPGIAAAWLWIAPRGRLTAVRQLLAGGAAMAAVALAWPLMVALTPAGDRPWISGTADNSIWSLIFGYNGLGRIFGQQGGPGGGAGGPGGGGPGGAGNGLFGGDPGWLRLLNQALGGQAGWFLGFALAGGVGVLVLTRLRRADPRTGWLLAVGGAALVTAVAFSRAQGIFHPYYVSLLAPFVAALVGAGAGEILRNRSVARILGPAAIAGGVLTEVLVLRKNPGELAWLPAALCGAGAFAAVVLASGVDRRVRTWALGAVMAVLLIGPGTWAVQTLGHATSGTFPAGGPTTAGIGGPGGGGPPGAGSGGGPGGGMFGGNGQTLTQAIAYAKAHGGGTVAVSSQNGAASTLISTGANVAAVGGFSGRESQVSVSWLADAVADGRIRWVLTDSAGGMPNDGRVGSTVVMAAVQQVGKKTSVSGLYDLQGTSTALHGLEK